MSPTTTKTIECEMRVKARPETVFSYFTDAEKYRRWKGVEAELDPRPGGIYRVQMTERGTWIRGEYVAVEPPTRLVFTWGWESRVELPRGIAEVTPGSTTVEVTFVPDGDATIVRLRHDGFPTDDAVKMHSWGWGVYLERLTLAATGGDPGPDPLNAGEITP